MRDRGNQFLGYIPTRRCWGNFAGGRGWREPLLEFYITRAYIMSYISILRFLKIFKFIFNIY